jgi:hypothetical protein
MWDIHRLFGLWFAFLGPDTRDKAAGSGKYMQRQKLHVRFTFPSRSRSHPATTWRNLEKTTITLVILSIYQLRLAGIVCGRWHLGRKEQHVTPIKHVVKCVWREMGTVLQVNLVISSDFIGSYGDGGRHAVPLQKGVEFYRASTSRVRSAVQGPVFRGCLQGQ